MIHGHSCANIHPIREIDKKKKSDKSNINVKKKIFWHPNANRHLVREKKKEKKYKYNK